MARGQGQKFKAGNLRCVPSLKLLNLYVVTIIYSTGVVYIYVCMYIPIDV